MANTPDKRTELIKSQLTPVKFLDSPKQSSTNVTTTSAYKSRLDAIVKSLLEDFNKWLLAEKRGLSLCRSIEAIKTRCLEAASASKQESGGVDKQIAIYPDELKPYTKKLASILQILEDITVNCVKASKQLNALGKMETIRNQVFYRTWTLENFITLSDRASNAYQKELKIKSFVTHEIAHCLHRVDLVRMTSLWEYPQFLDDWIKQLYIFLKIEINSNTRS